MSASKRNFLDGLLWCSELPRALVHSANEVYAQTPLPPVTVDEPDRQTVRRAPAQRSTGRAKQAPRRVAAPASGRLLTHSVSHAGDRRAWCAAAPYAGGQVATGGQLDCSAIAAS